MQLCPCYVSEHRTPNMQLSRICFSLPFCKCILSVCCMVQGVGLEYLLSVLLGVSTYGAIDRTQALRNSSQKFYHGSSPLLVFNLTFCTIPHSQVGGYLHFFSGIFQAGWDIPDNSLGLQNPAVQTENRQSADEPYLSANAMHQSELCAQGLTPRQAEWEVLLINATFNLKDHGVIPGVVLQLRLCLHVYRWGGTHCDTERTQKQHLHSPVT